MGIILSRFRKKKTTIEVLEDLDSKIKEIEEYGQTTEQRHKKIVGTLVIYSVLLYVVTAVIFYFYFFPASLYDQLFYITPLLIFPILIIFTKKMVTWYYKRKISRNHEKMSDMQKEKKKILEEVTETETYKKAKEILMKFAPDQLRMTPLTPQPSFKSPSSTAVSPRPPTTPQASTMPLTGGNELRKRAIAATSPALNTSVVGTMTPINSSVTPFLSGYHAGPTMQMTPSIHPNMRSINASLIRPPRSPLPRPILSPQRSYLDRLVEYLVGDGPSNRYALICRQCDSHNGMALKEEFEYFGFRCCYCNFWNPARKQKPSAPKLDGDMISSPLSAGLQTFKTREQDNSSSSGTDSDIEVVEKPETDDNDATEPENLEEKTSLDDDKEKVSDTENIEETTKVEEAKAEEMEVDESPRK